MGRFWALCLEPDFNGNSGNFVNGSNPPQHGVFWATGDVAGAGPYTFSNVTFFAADDVPTMYDGDQVFYAVNASGVGGGQDVQDIVVLMGRIHTGTGPISTIGSPVKLGSGSPRCLMNKDGNTGSALTSIVLPGPGAGTTTLKAVGPIKIAKDSGNGRPQKSRFESVIVARVGTAANNITSEFAFDPEVDIDNGL